MAKERSPNYPQIPLGEAVELVKKFYGVEGRTSVDNETAVKAIGYTGVSGASRTKLGALKQYGLLHGRGDKISITSLGLRLVHPDDQADYDAALQEAARAPVIFTSLLDSHTEASDNAIIAYLVKSKNFTQDGARQVAKAFKDSVSFAKLAIGVHTDTGRREDNSGQKGSGMDTQQNRNLNPPPPPPPQSEGSVAFNVPYRGATLSVRVEVKGQPLGRAHVDKVVRYLQLVAEDFPDVAPAAPEAASLTKFGDDGPNEDD